MGYSPVAPTSPLLYPQSIQIKLYQAFIFSIPILFSIILFLLFYLFYLKRRASTVSVSSPQTILPRSLLEFPFSSSSEMGFKGNHKDKLPIILFDEDLSKTRDSMCSVCLGEFEMKEELHQIPTCKHMFHVDCIRYWAHSNPTCPLCRCRIITTNGRGQSQPPVVPNQNPQMVSDPEQQEQGVRVDSDMANNLREHQMVVLMEGSSSTSGGTSTCLESEMGYPHHDSVALTVRLAN